MNNDIYLIKNIEEFSGLELGMRYKEGESMIQKK